MPEHQLAVQMGCKCDTGKLIELGPSNEFDYTSVKTWLLLVKYQRHQNLTSYVGGYDKQVNGEEKRQTSKQTLI